jgi:peptidoglycan/xylan/chitin deacetylase (PgdA/CDA1 family)
MYVSPETLAMHLAVLKRHFEIVDLGDWVGRCEAEQALPDRACAITFDDGWRDNFEYGLAVLQDAGAPATVFLVADLVGTNHQFWPNRLSRLLLSTEEPADVMPVPIMRRLAEFGLDLRTAGRPLSMNFVDAVVRACKSYSDEEMLRLTDEVSVVVGGNHSKRDLLDREEITVMQRSGLIRFGSHGRTHKRLTDQCERSVIEDEVLGSRERIQSLTGQPVNIFCYPNGDVSPTSISAVRSAYMAGVTGMRGWNYPRTERHVMHRMSMHEDVAADESSFLARVSGLA